MSVIDIKEFGGELPSTSPRNLPVNGIMTPQCVARLADAVQRTRAVASSKAVPLIDQSNWRFTVLQMVDPYHPTPDKMHLLNVSLGASLRPLVGGH